MHGYLIPPPLISCSRYCVMALVQDISGGVIIFTAYVVPIVYRSH